MKKLTQNELREKIANLRGYKRLTKREQEKACAANCYGRWKSPHGNATVLPDWTRKHADAWQLVEEMQRERVVVLRSADFEDGGKIRCCELEGDASFDYETLCLSVCAAYLYFKRNWALELITDAEMLGGGE